MWAHINGAVTDWPEGGRGQSVNFHFSSVISQSNHVRSRGFALHWGHPWFKKKKVFTVVQLRDPPPNMEADEKINTVVPFLELGVGFILLFFFWSPTSGFSTSFIVYSQSWVNKLVFCALGGWMFDNTAKKNLRVGIQPFSHLEMMMITFSLEGDQLQSELH